MNFKVLFIMHLPPPIHGAAMMGKYLQESKLVNESFDCSCINLATADSLSDIGKFGIKKLIKFLNLLKHIHYVVKGIRPDLVYITPNAGGGAFYKDFIIVEMLKGMGCKVVAHYHNKGVAKKQNRWPDNWLYKCFFKDLKVILLAEALYKDIEKYVKREDVFICPNGIPDEQMLVSHQEKTREKNHFLFLSNLLREKGIITLLEACENLARKGYTFVCDVVGGETSDFDAQTFQEETDKRNLRETVIYHGKKYGKEKAEFYARANAFIFPTYNDCFPLVLLEAMQHELACIASNEGGIPNIIDEGVTGYIIPSKDAKALADKMEYLLTHPQKCREMGKAGYEKYRQEFTLERFEQRMTEILSTLLG